MSTKLKTTLLAFAPAIGLAVLTNSLISLFWSLIITQPFSLEDFWSNFVKLSDIYTIQYLLILTGSYILFARFPSFIVNKTTSK